MTEKEEIEPQEKIEKIQELERIVGKAIDDNREFFDALAD